MKVKMYRVKEIEQLAQKYAKTGNDKIFEALIRALIPLIDIQSARRYPDLKEYWDDIKQEVLLKLWKNRTSLSFTASKKLYRFLYNRIHRDLFRAIKKIKKKIIGDVPEKWCSRHKGLTSSGGATAY